MLRFEELGFTEDEKDRLLRAFPPIEVKPDTTIEEIMYDAGKQYIINWLITRAEKRAK